MKLDTDQLIGDIYAAATDAAGWNIVFAKLQQAFCGNTALYERLHAAPQTHQLIATDLDPDFVRAYNQGYNALNVWATSPLNQVGNIIVSEQMIARNDLERTQFYGEWLRPQGLTHALTSPLLRQEHRSLNIGLVRDHRRGEYGTEEGRLFGRLLPHLRRSVEIASRVEASALARAASLETVAADGTCLLVVSETGEIRFASPEAEALLAERTVLTTRGLRLAGVARAEDANLARAIQAATRVEPAPVGSLLTLEGFSHAPRHSVAVAPIGEERAGLFHEGRLCLVLVAKPRDVAVPSAQTLAIMFGLTPAEARLARAICNGESLATYAAATGVGVTTVKSHLRALFGKMGVNRQADIVRIVLTNPILTRG